MPSHDWFTKFTRAWAAGFACQIVVIYLVGYLLVWLYPPARAGHQLGLMLVLVSEMAVVPSAVFTAVVACLCLTFTDRLKTAVITTGVISFACLMLFLLASGLASF